MITGKKLAYRQRRVYQGLGAGYRDPEPGEANYVKRKTSALHFFAKESRKQGFMHTQIAKRGEGDYKKAKGYLARLSGTIPASKWKSLGVKLEAAWAEFLGARGSLPKKGMSLEEQKAFMEKQRRELEEEGTLDHLWGGFKETASDAWDALTGKGGKDDDNGGWGWLTWVLLIGGLGLAGMVIIKVAD